MARKPKPWYRESRDAWYATISGHQIELVKGKANEALAWEALKTAGPVEKSELRVDELVVLYLAHMRLTCVETTVKQYSRILKGFVKALGGHGAASLKVKDVTAWLDSHPGWRDGGRGDALKIAKGCFRWAEEQDYIEVSPIRKMKKPPQGVRELVLTGDQARACIADPARPDFSVYLEALWESGARPGEVASVTAKEADLGLRIWTVRNKTRRKTGEVTRKIYLSDRLSEITRKLVEQHPEGPLFRTRTGLAWTGELRTYHVRRLRKKLGYGPEVACQAFRHLFITDALERGVPIATVAALVGHTSTNMISRVYGKLRDRSKHLQDAMDQIRPKNNSEK